MLERIDRNKYEDWEWEQELKRRRQERQWLEQQEEEKRKRMKKLERRIVFWGTFGIFFGIPALVFLFQGATAIHYMALVVMLNFTFPILPFLWLAVMTPVAICFKKYK